jgi:hypothetical protein
MKEAKAALDEFFADPHVRELARNRQLGLASYQATIVPPGTIVASKAASKTNAGTLARPTTFASAWPARFAEPIGLSAVAPDAPDCSRYRTAGRPWAERRSLTDDT